MTALDAREGYPYTGIMTDDTPTPEQRTTVYVHGARRMKTGEISDRGREKTRYPDFTDGGIRQLWLAHQMQNQLVELRHRNEEAIAAVWQTVPHLAKVIEDQAQAQATVDDLVAKVKQQQSQRRGKEKADTSLRETLKAARAALKDLKVQVRAVKEEVYAQIEPQLVELREKLKADIKAVRQRFATDGLYWATYNAVIEHHQTSHKNIVRKRTQGQPAAHRFHRWQNEGVLAVQLQRMSDDPPRSPELLASGEGKWRNVLQVKPYVPPEQWAQMTSAERKQIMRSGEIVFRVSSDETVTIPVQLDRMLPPEADIVGAQLVRRNRADRGRTLSVALTAKVPVTPYRDTGPVVALHVGWRVRDDDSLRVGTWVSTEPLKVPDLIQDIVISHGTWGEIIFPAAWRKEFDFVESLRSRRDKNLEIIKSQVAEFLDEGGKFKNFEVPVSRLDSDNLTSPSSLTGGMVKLWRSPTRIYALFESVKDTDHPMVEVLRDWVRQDRHLWRFEAGRRSRLLGRRKHRYQNAVAWLARTARVVVIDDINLAALARTKETDDTRIALARANRFLAAPGDLRRYMENAAATYGARLRKTGTVVGRLTHHKCGTVSATPEEYMDQVVLFCDACGHGYDQDVNMGRLLLAAAGEAPPVPVAKNKGK